MPILANCVCELVWEHRMSIKLEPAKLLGFRIVTKTGAKVGGKVGGKGGVKVGLKTGVKLGAKPGAKGRPA